MNDSQAHRVVIVGGGFGGLYAARQLRRTTAHVTLIDRRNFHLFQPLLYQVATGGLSPADVSAPLRSILKHDKRTRVHVGDVVDIDATGKHVELADGSRVPYDSLLIAVGMRYHYFGNDQWAEVTGSLKTVEDALDIRRRIFSAFERAETASSDEERAAWLRFVVIGGGPTGVELAGAIAELKSSTLRGGFRAFDSRQAEVILLEGGARVLPPYPEGLSGKAEASLRRLGVNVRTGAMVKHVDDGVVVVDEGGQEQRIEAHTVLWAAGMKTTPLADRVAAATGAEQDRQGRIIVDDCLHPAGHDDIFVVGDMAHFSQDGTPLPGIAPVAMQQGRYVARIIRDRLRGRETKPFRYFDKGQMAVIGRHAAVCDLGRLRFSGGLAWLMWLFVHIAYLIEYDNRLRVLGEWAWSYLTRRRGARLITGADGSSNDTA